MDFAINGIVEKESERVKERERERGGGGGGVNSVFLGA
jgi:hypothetical protein